MNEKIIKKEKRRILKQKEVKRGQKQKKGTAGVGKPVGKIFFTKIIFECDQKGTEAENKKLKAGGFSFFTFNAETALFWFCVQEW